MMMIQMQHWGVFLLCIIFCMSLQRTCSLQAPSAHNENSFIQIRSDYKPPHTGTWTNNLITALRHIKKSINVNRMNSIVLLPLLSSMWAVIIISRLSRGDDNVIESKALILKKKSVVHKRKKCIMTEVVVVQLVYGLMLLTIAFLLGHLIHGSIYRPTPIDI